MSEVREAQILRSFRPVFLVASTEEATAERGLAMYQMAAAAAALPISGKAAIFWPNVSSLLEAAGVAVAVDIPEVRF